MAVIADTPGRLREVAVALCAVVLVASACTNGTASRRQERPSQVAGGASPTEEVVTEDFVYRPHSVEVRAGGRVRWTNNDLFAHTVTSGEPGEVTGQFDGDLGDVNSADAAGTTFEVSFSEPGTYPYFCRLHPRMRAEVVVLP